MPAVLVLFGLWVFAGSTPPETREPEELLIDDFARDDGQSALGTEWRYFADRVMGGISDGDARREVVDGRPAMHLFGTVKLENNGGFIQIRLPFREDGAGLDGSGFAGVRLQVRGNGEKYELHLRTSDCVLPWQYYAATFEAGDAWRELYLPWSAFKPEATDRPLRRERLTTIGVVAIKRAYKADVWIGRLALSVAPDGGAGGKP